jgi:histidyl-tRNA synthetase
MAKLQAPRGTFDVLPGAARRRLRLRREAAEVLGRAGYEPFETPIFEETELFARGVGEATDIVQKEMFTFEDKAGRSLTLRPEATAAMCRAYVEHGMHKLAQPVKLWTWGPFFRHEAPQAGRYRQFTQLDVEALGSDDPSLDAELILLLADLIERAGAGPARLRLSSLGSPETRAAYLEELTSYLRAREGELSDEVRERLDQNPLRAFDADHAGTRAVMDQAPRLLDRLDPADAEHFADVRGLLEAAGMPYDVDSTLVRGLDYYTRTVFEFESERLGAQAALGGGGRYDRLVEELGGPATPGVGWAAGIERILLASSAEDEAEARVYVALAKPDLMRTAFDVARRLRGEGIRAEIEQAGRSLRGQLKQADRIGARTTVILGDSMDVRDMESGEQREASTADEVVGLVKDTLRERAPANAAPENAALGEEALGRGASANAAPAKDSPS